MMNDKPNLILALVLSGIVMLGWQYFFVPPPFTPKPAEEQERTVQNKTSTEGEVVIPNAPEANGVKAETITQSPATQDSSPNAPSIKIETADSVGEISLLGARLHQLSLRDYHQELENNSENIAVLKTGALSYYAYYGWTGKGTTLPDHQTLWQADHQTLSPEQPVTFSWTNPEQVRFEITYRIKDRFLFAVDQRVVNNSGKPLSLAPYGLISRGGTPETSGFYILHEGLIGVFNDTLEEIDYDTVLEDGRLRYASERGWIGITDKYWLVAQIPAPEQPFNATFSGQQASLEPRYQTDFVLNLEQISDKSTSVYSSHLFVGAKETTLLDRYRDELNFAHFDLAVDFGVLYFITKPIFYMIDYLFHLLGNFGLAIIALTFGIKLLFFPLSNKSYVSMSKMKLLQPKMLELKERYGDDRQKLNTEMMALYKREQVNPLAGCLPILLQIPVFFALYKVLFVAIEMRHAPFYGWIHDLSAPDPLGVLTGFGLIEWQVPAILAIVNIGLWPIIMGLTMWLQQRLNPAPADPIQAKIFAWMPVFFTFLLATFPAGLVIYWACNNTLTIIQQWIIMRRLNAQNAK